MDNRFWRSRRLLLSRAVFGEMEIGRYRARRSHREPEPEEDITFSSPTTTTTNSSSTLFAESVLARQAPALLVGGLKDGGRAAALFRGRRSPKKKFADWNR